MGGFGLHSVFIPAIYLHLGRVAGLPVVLTTDGAGLTMTKNRALFLLPKVWPFFNSLVPGVLLRGRSAFRALSLWGTIPGLNSGLPPWLRVHRLEWPFSYYLYFGGFSGGLGFFGGSVCGGTPSSSFVPSSFIRPRSKV